jgi:hypothetical protein
MTARTRPDERFAFFQRMALSGFALRERRVGGSLRTTSLNDGDTVSGALEPVKFESTG